MFARLGAAGKNIWAVLVSGAALTGAILSILVTFGVIDNVESADVRLLHNQLVVRDPPTINVAMENSGDGGTGVRFIRAASLEKPNEGRPETYAAETREGEREVYAIASESYSHQEDRDLGPHESRDYCIECFGECSGVYSFVIFMANGQKIFVQGSFEE